MTATNHAVTGAVIALAVKQPALALPLAFLSHFALDALPHFGFKNWHERQEHKKLFLVQTVTDLSLALLMCLLLFLKAPLVLLTGAILAMSPDLMWGFRFVVREKMGTLPPPPENIIEKFHKGIQKFESVVGLWIEIPYGIAVTWILLLHL